MEYFIINNKNYKLVVGNGKDDTYRESFNVLTKKTFGFNFAQWYQEGYWKDQYIPYSLMDGDKVVSNVSVNIMNIEVFGKSKHLIQLGTVMTDEAYRNKGLIRAILDKVIEDWQLKCDYIYLFANNSVLDFYPKFGFHKLNQYQCSKTVSKKDKVRAVKKLNMLDETDKKLVCDKVNISTSFGQIAMLCNAELIMFYCISFLKDSVYYIEEYDAVVIANYEHDVLELLGLFCEIEVSLDDIIDQLATENTKSVKLFFTPKETDSYIVKPLEGEDTLFILGEDTRQLANEHFMFPSLSHT